MLGKLLGVATAASPRPLCAYVGRQQWENGGSQGPKRRGWSGETDEMDGGWGSLGQVVVRGGGGRSPFRCWGAVCLVQDVHYPWVPCIQLSNLPASPFAFLCFQNAAWCWLSCLFFGYCVLELCFGTLLTPLKGSLLSCLSCLYGCCVQEASWRCGMFINSKVAHCTLPLWAKWLSWVIRITNFTDKMVIFLNLV